MNYRFDPNHKIKYTRFKNRETGEVLLLITFPTTYEEQCEIQDFLNKKYDVPVVVTIKDE